MQHSCRGSATATTASSTSRTMRGPEAKWARITWTTQNHICISYSWQSCRKTQHLAPLLSTCPLRLHLKPTSEMSTMGSITSNSAHSSVSIISTEAPVESLGPLYKDPRFTLGGKDCRVPDFVVEQHGDEAFQQTRGQIGSVQKTDSQTSRAEWLRGIRNSHMDDVLFCLLIPHTTSSGLLFFFSCYSRPHPANQSSSPGAHSRYLILGSNLYS